MGILKIDETTGEVNLLGEVSFPLDQDLPARFSTNSLRRTNRVNIRLRDEDITRLEEMALKSGMPFQSFLADIIHQYALNNQD